MKGVVLYTPQEAQRNAFSVDLFQSELPVQLAPPTYRGPADFVINRSNDPAPAQFYEARGVRVFNPAAFTELANDKDACYRYMAANGVPILPIDYKTPPLVVKPKNGRGGQGVRLITGGEIPKDPNFVYQKAADTPGRDLRVWVLGGKIITAALRISDTDFRANYCLGGRAVLHTLTEEEKRLVQKVIALVQGDYYAVDLLFDGGHPVFNELEDAVGARMVYDLTKIDILRLYCKYVRNVLSL